MKFFELKSTRFKVLTTIGVLAYLLIIGLPMVIGRSVKPGSSIESEHTWSSAIYRLEVEEGETYAFTVSSSTFWGFDFALKLYSSPLKLSGELVDDSASVSETIVFTAAHSGHYYVTVDGGGSSGFFDVSLQQTAESETITSPYFNVLKMGLLLLPLILLSLLSLGIQKLAESNKRYKNKFQSMPRNTGAYDSAYDAAYQQVDYLCEYCGIEFTGKKHNQTCPNCGAFLKNVK